ncbi:MAG TPA: class I SAM-dependent methyltransferase [Gemmatimonadaceae bacterium]
MRRKIHMVAAVTEYFLGRKLRSVLDVGAGEGVWGVELRRLYPRVRYVGIDSSAYVLEHFGRERNIVRGSFETLPSLRLGGEFDLIVCADMLQYLPTPVLKRGIHHLARRLVGVAYLEAFTEADEMEGDLDGWHPRTRAQYRRIFTDAGLVGCGLHCYLTAELAEKAVELELSGA